MSGPLLGGIEAGGTKFVCAVGEPGQEPLRRAAFATRTPDQTLIDVIGFFRSASTELGPIAALGIGSFGPLDLAPASPAYGSLTGTPKPGWSGVNLRATLEKALDCPTAIDTDVNAAGLGEAVFGAGRGLDSFVYLTIGTGIGGGLIVGGRPLHGLTHPEMGHLLVRRHAVDEGFAGACPFHGDCVEGLASGAAIFARAGKPLSDYPPDHPLREAIADYLGQLCAAIVLIASPQRLILGGGVMTGGSLLPGIRRALATRLGGYVGHPALRDDLESYIVPPALGDRAGITGALILASRAAP
jgi:fructokinase